MIKIQPNISIKRTRLILNINNNNLFQKSSRVANVTIVPTQEQSQRLSQMIVKKINANGRILMVNQHTPAASQAATINKTPPSVTVSTANQRGGPR